MQSVAKHLADIRNLSEAVELLCPAQHGRSTPCLRAIGFGNGLHGAACLTSWDSSEVCPLSRGEGALVMATYGIG